MDSSSIFIEDFGQKVDLTRRIREVLLNYPEGTTVLKEIIQNADDAGATVVRLCLDRRFHSTDSLLSNSLSQWQGPALLAYNDAVFSEDDFVSISRIGGSSKHSQASTTGRFGVGFNSVYHLTDLPSFVSGKYIVLFDPQGIYLPNVSAANPGKRIDYVSSSAISIYKDQFFPYCAFGCDMVNPFIGTLFRFPLRNADQAVKSKLSRQAYADEDISSMFHQMYEEGVLSLLFLKSVLSIEMYIWDDGQAEPRKLYSCSVSSLSSEAIRHRQAFLTLSKTMNSKDNEMDSFSLDFLSEASTGTLSERKVDTFYIVQTMASRSSRIGLFAAAVSRDYDIHLLPWASVAACISASDTSVLKLGGAFCFLPLPVKTGLRVQINAYFEVSSNRRDIWYGDDMDRSGKIRCLWNRLLLEDVVAPTFTQLLLGVQPVLGPTDSYHSLWPTGTFEGPWQILVENIYRKFADAPVLYSEVGGGRWISPVEAFIHDLGSNKNGELQDGLVQLGLPIVCLSSVLFDTIVKFSTTFQQKVVTPHSVRYFLKERGDVNPLNKSRKLVLLEYCLEDLIDADVGDHLYNLPLLPLANGDFGLFLESSNGNPFFLCNELEFMLLEKISDKLVDRHIPLHLLSRLTAIAKSSKVNLIIFGVHNFVQVLPRLVPADWKYKSKVLWELDNCHNHPSKSWFLLFWQYIRTHCEKLSLLNDWPIFPSTSGCIYRASRQSRLIRVGGLSVKMQEILKKIGCKILHSGFGVEHQDLSQYICESDIKGVLEAIFDVLSMTGGTNQTFLQNLGAEEKDELRNYLLDLKWYVGQYTDDFDLQKCMKLPIYKVFSNGHAQNFLYADLESPRKFLAPLNTPDIFLGEEFIKPSSNIEEEILSRYLGVERMAKTHFYKDRVFCRLRDLQPEFRENVMLSVLKDLPQLCHEDSSFKDYLRNLEFVPTINGMIKCPSALYDPRIDDLCALLENSDCFPHGTFEKSEILDMLQGLGLKTSVSPETVLESARQVELLMHKDQNKAYARGKVLLSFLEVNAVKWLPHTLEDEQGKVNRILSLAATAFRPRNLKSDLERFWTDLRMICWCPVLDSSPFENLPWPSVSSKVAPPKLARLQSDLWFVSASMRILDGECSSTALAYALGWSVPPGGNVIAAQLLELGKNNEIVNDLAFRQELALAMPRIYSILTGLQGSDELDIVKAILEGSRWIWVGDGFATAKEVVLEGALHMAPYIRIIPVDLAVFRELFIELGVKEFLKPADYVDILHTMATKKVSSPLDAHEMRAAILIIHHLSEVQNQDGQVNIYLPDVSGRLFPASELVYNDAPWLLNSEDSDHTFGSSSNVALNATRSVQRFVHGNISNDVADRLGVCSLRRILLAENADSMNLSLSGAAEAFGQHETLTTRLKHILEMYADGPGILFELVQNAEDAGASEVTFLLDKTQYGTSSVLSPEMVDWQGPALYCFNDSVFSPQDLYAISRIGQESKLEKPFAIGRFGLGFNCVYHFTDVPSFVSGENIVMFDPHACNLPGITPSHPGLRIKFMGTKLLEQFPDQFSPYLHFGCDLQHRFPGTLFRFPLRSANVASRSQIKKEIYTIEDVASLFASFSDVVSNALLFLQNVKTINIFVKEGSGLEMDLLHHVHKDSIKEPQIESHVFGFMDQNKHSGMDREQFVAKLCRSIDKDIPYRCQKIVVKERGPSGTLSHFWITSECLGNGKSKNHIPTSIGKSGNLVPWACVAAHLHSAKAGDESNGIPRAEDGAVTPDTSEVVKTNQEGKDLEGRAFCFLPLPVSTGLPVHVNAFFELSSNRRDIWFGNDMVGHGKKRSDWNIYLLEGVASPAYGHLLEKLALEIGPGDLFFSFWPTSIRVEPWASLVRNVYSSIVDFDLRVLYTKARGGQWISAKQAIIPDLNFHKASELIDALSDAGLPLVKVSESLVQKFRENCPSLHFLTPRFLRALLIRRRLNFKDRKGMILTLEYCLLDLGTAAEYDTLKGLPLLPLADGSFSIFEKNGAGGRIYIARGDDEYGLLKDVVPHQLVEFEISEEVHAKLCDIAQNGDSNISFLSSCLLEKLLLKVLPSEWQQTKQVTWSPGQQGQPSVEWMKLFWSYLRMRCDDLLLFSKWPILPVGTDSLFQLVENSNVIRNDGWSENMSSLLVKVGCRFLRDDMPIEHPQLEKFVQPPTAIGVLDALISVAGETESIRSLFDDVSEGELHDLKAFILQSKWFSEGHMGERQTSIIRNLPIFESYRSRKLVTLNRPNKWLKPEGVCEGLLNDDFIRTETDREKIILTKFLEVAEVARAEFYTEYALKNMSQFSSKAGAISAVLHNIKLLIEEDTSIKPAISKIHFILAADGCWKQPSRLYDPRIPELHNMLHGEAFFPSESFSDPDILEVLVLLGLRQSLGLIGLIDSARSVSMIHDTGDSEAINYARRLLLVVHALAVKHSGESDEKNNDELLEAILCRGSNHFDGNSNGLNLLKESETHLSLNMDKNLVLGTTVNDISEEVFWSEMKTISWCPICIDPPFPGLPWLKSNVQVASPSMVRPKPQMWMVSSKMHILDGDCHSLYMLQKLGWTDRPSLKVLLSQLVAISRSYCELKSNSLVEPAFVDALLKGLPTLYSKLKEFIGTNEFALMKSELDGISWVWVGDNFVSANALAFDSPVKFHPYLYAVPSELEDFKDLLLELGVKPSFEVWDYLRILQHLQNDVKESTLTSDQLNFVICILEAIGDFFCDKSFPDASNFPLLIPNSFGVLTHVGDLLYNDAPWMEITGLSDKQFIHPHISNDLANKLGVQSLRSLSLVDKDMTRDLPCMDHDKIKELLGLFGGGDFLLFDLLELADCCRGKKLHLIIDKREHPSKSLLQHNLAEFQGPALVAILEGVSFSREDISSLQLRPPWRLYGDTLNYGLGLLSCYTVSDLLSVVSGGYLYMFDPRGLVLAKPSNHAPTAKVFSLLGTNLTTRFHDQFNPLLIGQDILWSSSESTLIRMPLSPELMKDGHEIGLERINQVAQKFLDHASRVLLFLKSVSQVSLSMWEKDNLQPVRVYSAAVDSSFAVIRNPFSEKKWRKFQISRLFGSSNTSTKVHTIDVNVYKGADTYVDRWLVVLSMGSGQTRNMALDRRYLAYNLTPVAGVAAKISGKSKPVEGLLGGSILSPLPLSSDVNLPVTILGCFLVCHNRGRYLFKYQDREELPEACMDAGNQLIEAWNRELMSCVVDSYTEMAMQMQNLRRESSSTIECGVTHEHSISLKVGVDRRYSFWPCSKLTYGHSGEGLPATRIHKADWECVIERLIRPFYARAVDLPLWQLYSGNLVKATEGMFLSQPGNGVADNLLPTTVCDFVKEQYPVFSVPWELVAEIQAIGVRVQEIKPKMVRELLRAHSASIVLQSVDAYIDVLEYCVSDIQFLELTNSSEEETLVDRTASSLTSRTTTSIGINASSWPTPHVQSFPGPSSQGPGSSGDALEMVTSLGKALFDFGRGVVEDIGRTGSPLLQRNNAAFVYGNMETLDHKVLSVAVELKGLPCPTAKEHLARLGVTELWLGSREQQFLMSPLVAKFIHPKALDRSLLGDIFSNSALQASLQLQSFSFPLLSRHMELLFDNNWVAHVRGTNLAPWFSWEYKSNSSSGWGPSPEWIRLFWKNFSGSSSDLSLFSEWPLIPAFLGRSILCRVKERSLVFIPPPVTDASIFGTVTTDHDTGESSSLGPCLRAFEITKQKYPWLLSLLNQCNIPIFDQTYIECAASCNCLPPNGQSLGQAIASKLVDARNSGYFLEITSISASDRDELVSLFANDFPLNGSSYGVEELEVLKSLPIYKTAVGSYASIGPEHCVISSNSFLKPRNEHCLSYTMDSAEGQLLRALSIPELHDQQILVRFGLPGYDGKPQSEQEDILIYLYMNWQELQVEPSVIEALKETRFVRNADEFSLDLFKPKELFDPSDMLLTSVFSGERGKFPGERFTTEGWLRILKKTGLRSAGEAEVILECARRVEFLGTESMKAVGDLDGFEADILDSQNEVPTEIHALAGSVVDSIFSNFAVFYSNSFCNALGKIACIPAEQGFPNVAGKKGGRRVLTSYSDAILLKDWPLSWSCAPILTRQNVIPPEYSLGPLNLRSPPPFSRVLKHLQVIGRNGGEDTLVHWPVTSGIMSVGDATLEILKYLDKVWASLSSSDIMELQKVAFIPTANGTRLVTANSLFVHLTINLSPFAFELPSLFLPYLKLLKDLGLQDALSVASAKSLLLDLQKGCGYQRLNPNELRSVMEILSFVCDGIANANVANRVSLSSEAVIPDDGCRLVHAQTCVYIDPYGSQYVKYIDTSRLRFVHPDLPDHICEALDIKKLSDVVIEQVSHKEQLQPLEYIGSVSLSSIKEKMLCSSFQGAVWTLVNSMSKYIPATSHLSVETTQNAIKLVAEKLQFVKQLYTKFLLIPGQIDITKPAKHFLIPEWDYESHHQTLFFMDGSKACILVAEPPSYISVLDVISIVLSQVIGSPIPLPVTSLLAGPSDSGSTILDVMGLHSYKRELEQRHGTNSLLGKEIFPQDACQVQFHPLRPFYKGEIVAWHFQKREKLRYGRVPEDVSPSAGQALYRLKVETKPGVTEPLLSSQVFSFKNLSLGSISSSTNLQDGGHAVYESSNHIGLPENFVQGGASSSQTYKELQYGRVSAVELVQAVSELLSTAGIHMDVEKQSLLQNAISIQEQFKESQAALLLEQGKLDKATKEADAAKAAWVCRVCLTAEVDVAFVPCGHVLCRRCSSAVSRCPFCRLQVTKAMRIFRP